MRGPVVPLIFFYSAGDHLYLHSFPTRRSSDLGLTVDWVSPTASVRANSTFPFGYNDGPIGAGKGIDRKSTRLNSSHVSISYSVFCLKKKKRCKTGGPLSYAHPVDLPSRSYIRI